MSKKGAKRFYKAVTVTPQEDGWAICLDGRTLKTPGKLPLTADSQDTAQLIADEWDAQVEYIKPETMPVTRLLNVALERTPQNRDEIVAEYRAYAGTDLTCYRAQAPQELRALQARTWDPVMGWASDKFGGRLVPTEGIVAIAQDETLLEQYAAYARLQDHIDLTLLVHFTAVFGSAILGAAVMEQHLSAEQALNASRLDELYQIEQWGEDEEAQIRTQTIKIETLALSRLIQIRKRGDGA